MNHKLHAKKRRIGGGWEMLESRAMLTTLPTGFSESVVADTLTAPTAMVRASDGRIFVAEQGGDLRVVKNNALLPNPFLSLSVNDSGERGLLGVALDPAFASNHYVYVYYTVSTAPIHNRVSRFTASGDVAVANSEVVLLDLDNLSSATNHNGGAIHFGLDGKLYVAVGDNANGANAQSLNNTLGKILRINPDPLNVIPSDNPFLTQTTGINQAIWAYGLRNPYTFNVQPKTGAIFINDVGQSTWEEINVGASGANYGWPTTEGPTTNANFVSPIYAYQHNSGNPTGVAITGGAFYQPNNFKFPANYKGDYFFTDIGAGWIWKYDLATDTASEFATGTSAPVDLQVGNDGNLYYLSRGTGALMRISYVNQGPTFSQLNSVTNYIEPIAANQASQFKLFPQGLIADDSNRVAGGTLTVHYASGATAADRIGLKSEGDFTVVGNEAKYQGTTFATFTGGVGSADFVVTFNNQASAFYASVLFRRIVFSNVSDAPSATPRQLTVQVTDGKGGTSSLISHTIQVTSKDDPPVVTPALITKTYAQNGAAISLYNTTAQVSDPDSSRYFELKFSYLQGSHASNRLSVVGNFSFNANQELLYQGTVVGQRNTNGGIGGNALILTLNAQMTETRVEELLRSLRFSTVNSNTLAKRVLKGALTTGNTAGTVKSFTEFRVEITVN
jgi:glucose/arabinose dehydrogenase